MSIEIPPKAFNPSLSMGPIAPASPNPILERLPNLSILDITLLTEPIILFILASILPNELPVRLPI